MDSQQIIQMENFFECLLAKMRANRKADMEEMEARLAEDRQAERRFLKEMMQIMEAGHKEIMAEIKPEMTSNTRTETMAYQEMEAHPKEEKEPTSVDRKPEAAQQR
jgi:hypothetical protein